MVPGCSVVSLFARPGILMATCRSGQHLASPPLRCISKPARASRSYRRDTQKPFSARLRTACAWNCWTENFVTTSLYCRGSFSLYRCAHTAVNRSHRLCLSRVVCGHVSSQLRDTLYNISPNVTRRYSCITVRLLPLLLITIPNGLAFVNDTLHTCCDIVIGNVLRSRNGPAS